MDESRHGVLYYIQKRSEQFGRFVADPYALDNLDGVNNPARRAALELTIKTKLVPRLLAHYFTHKDSSPYRAADLKVIGKGAQAIATIEPESSIVRKFHYPYIGEDEHSLRKHIAIMEARQALLVRYLGHMAVPQTYSVEPAPFDKTTPMIVAEQPYVAFDKSVNLPHMATHRPQDLGDVPSLPGFVDINSHMVQETRTISDIIGSKNLVIAEGQLRIIDPVPLVHSDPSHVNSYTRAVTIIEQINQPSTVRTRSLPHNT